MGKRLSKAVLEARAIALEHTCMCGCGKGHSGYKDEPRDSNEKLDSLTANEAFQQQQGLFAYADPVDVLIATQAVYDGENQPENVQMF